MKFAFALFAVLLVAGCGALGDRGEVISISKGEYGGMREAWLGQGSYCTWLGILKPETMTADQITAFLNWCQLQAP